MIVAFIDRDTQSSWAIDLDEALGVLVIASGLHRRLDAARLAPAAPIQSIMSQADPGTRPDASILRSRPVGGTPAKIFTGQGLRASVRAVLPGPRPRAQGGSAGSATGTDFHASLGTVSLATPPSSTATMTA